MKSLPFDLKTKLFADGANLETMFNMASMDYISGLTTNPTLMRKSGITNYKKFAKAALENIKNKPISFEVFSDDFNEMKNQAMEIASWADNVYVKIPITSSVGESTSGVVKYLVSKGVKVNVTAILTVDQVKSVLDILDPDIPSFVSVFAGRIADTGRDPIDTMKQSLNLLSKNPLSELIWASPRELLNIFQADEIGCHIITSTSEILNKLDLVGKDLNDYSLDTVKMFRNDSIASGFTL